MFKEGKNNSFVKWITIMITLIVLGVAVVASWKDNEAGVKSNTEKVGVLKEDGCKPARRHEGDIKVFASDMKTVKQDVEEVKGDFKEFRTEQTTRHTELLEAIRKK